MDTLETTQLTLPQRKVQLQELSPKHKLVAQLLSQGVGREEVAAAAGYAPDYITWLGGDPLFVEHVRAMSRLVDTHMEALYGKSVDVIADQMTFGAAEDKLKAARLQLEATGRIGKNYQPRGAGDGDGDRLSTLANRLINLLHEKQGERTYDGTAQVVSEQ